MWGKRVRRVEGTGGGKGWLRDEVLAGWDGKLA